MANITNLARQATITLAQSQNNDFGPAASGRFDFTILFEDVFLSIVPSVLLLLIGPSRLWALYKQPLKVKKSPLHESKLLFFGGYAILQLAQLVLWTISPALGSQASVSAASLSFLASLLLLGLSHLEHLRAVRPSMLINVYLLFTLLFDVAKVRTLWQNDATTHLAAVYSSSIGIKVLTLITEAFEKRDILLERFMHPSPEVTSGVYSLSTFGWLSSLLRLGSSQNLLMSDLYPVDDDMRTTTLLARSSRSWSEVDQEKPRAFLWSMAKSLRPMMLYAILPRFAKIGFKYAQPFLIARTITFASSATDADNVGWALIGAFGLVFGGLAVSQSVYKYFCIRFTTSVRGTLVTTIYSNTLTLGMGAFESSKALTLMSTDVEAICDASQQLFEFPASIVECGLAFFLIYRQAGIGFVSPAVVAALSVGVMSFVAKYMGRAQAIWIKAIETRVTSTASWITNAKVVKMLGFSDILENSLQKLRQDEVNLSRRFRKIFTIRVALSFLQQMLAPILTFGILIATGHAVNSSNIFSIISILTLLSGPISIIVQFMPQIATALKCFERIQEFLNSEMQKDHRLDLNTVEASQNLSSLDKEDLIVVQDANIGWPAMEAPILHNLNFTVKRGQMVFIIGPVGTGKSTLLQALVGEAMLKQGFVYTKAPHCAFVAQSPWIRNASVRENVLGVSNYDGTWYDAVVKACALDYDIAKMARGDKTLVGSGGISLSGGQKQRLALARAVYSKLPVIMIDDAFSGLDAETEERVFARLLGADGLIQKTGATVLLVTHAVHRLPYSDHILCLDSTGHISEQGSYSQLLRSDGYVSTLAKKSHPRRSSDSSEKEPEQEDPIIAESKAQAEILATEVEAEVQVGRGSGDLASYLYYFNTLGNRRVVIYALLTVLTGGSWGMQNLVLTFWTNAVETNGQNVNTMFLLVLAGLVFGSYLFTFILAWYFLVMMVPDSSELVHSKLLNTVMKAPLHYFTTTDVGTTVNRFSQDLTVFDIELPYRFVDFSLSAVEVLTAAVLMCVSATYFAATLPAVFGVVYLLQKYYLRTSRQIRLLDLEAKSPLYSHFIETLSGLMTVRAHGWQDHFQDKEIELLDASQKPFYLLFAIQGWLNFVLDLMVTILGMILMLIIVRARHTISGGFVGLALVNVMNFNQQLADVIRNWTGLETSLGAVSRIKSFTEETTPEDLPEEINEAPPNWPQSGRIELKDLTAAYSIDGKPVVHNVSLSINSGERIGLCGRSGSGKSSILATIFRMLELPDKSSSMTVDDIDLSTLTRQGIRRSINAIPQDPFFLHGSVRFNADPRHEHDDTAILSALHRVELADIVAAKGGLDADLDEDFFSHGQRQLFCLARAVLRKSTILVLDECTSSVDVKTDMLMQEIIREEFKTCTIIAVAHRLDTIMDFDRIIVLEAGNIVEVDTPKNLMARDSAFRRLYEA